MANVPTWRSQAAPSFDDALKAAADANKQQTQGMLQLAKGIGDTSDEYGDIVKNQAYNVLSKAIPKEGQTLAEARKDTREDPENAELFGSSWLGAKEMDAMEKTLGALDANKQKVKSRSTVMEQVRRLAAIDPLKDLADFCAREGLWLHIDGAIGGVFALSSVFKGVLVLYSIFKGVLVLYNVI